jgi:hypothetical protein
MPMVPPTDRYPRCRSAHPGIHCYSLSDHQPRSFGGPRAYLQRLEGGCRSQAPSQHTGSSPCFRQEPSARTHCFRDHELSLSRAYSRQTTGHSVHGSPSYRGIRAATPADRSKLWARRSVSTKRYSYRMNIEPILREIDAEINKLRQIRSIVERLLQTESQQVLRMRRERLKRAPVADTTPEPRVIVLPPRPQREYIRRARPTVAAPRALAAPTSSGPIFIPKAALRRPETAKAAATDSVLETAMRQKLLGGV